MNASTCDLQTMARAISRPCRILELDFMVRGAGLATIQRIELIIETAGCQNFQSKRLTSHGFTGCAFGWVE